MTNPAAAPVRTGQPAPLLIVEDDHALGDLLQRTLSEAGYDTARAVDGQQALSWLARACPQLLLLDLALPDMHGETVAAVARDRYGEALPIVVVSGFLRSDPRLPPVKAAAVLPKPFDVADLLGTLARVLR